MSTFITVGVVTKDPRIIQTIQDMVHQLGLGSLDNFPKSEATPSEKRNELYKIARMAKERVLIKAKEGMEVFMFFGEDAKSLVENMVNNSVKKLDWLLVDSTEDECPDAIIDNTCSLLNQFEIQFLCTALSRIMIRPYKTALQPSIFETAVDCPQYIKPYCESKFIELEKQLMIDFVDFLDVNVFNPLVKRRLRGVKNNGAVSLSEYGNPTTGLGAGLGAIMRSMSNSWLFGFYTGSVAAPFIQSVLHDTKYGPSSVINGCNEHSLACSALAAHQCHRASYVIAVTCGMMLEFKGTLLNLKRSGAPGVFVCGEGEPGVWYPAQGMINQDENIVDILNAMDIPAFILNETHKIETVLNDVKDKLHRKPGPVVILSSPRCFSASVTVDTDALSQATQTSLEKFADVNESTVDETIDILNKGPERLLWVIDDDISEKEALRIQRAARKLGVALADSVQRPGVVREYCFADTSEPSQYLGTLGIYGSSKQVMSFIYSDGKIRSKDEIAVFFLNSKMEQPSSPFVTGVQKNKLKSVQVCKGERYRNPYASFYFDSSLSEFLDLIEDKINPDESVLAKRKSILDGVRGVRDDIISTTGSLPVTPNFFFKVFSDVLHEKIKGENYRYRAIHDAGRCGFSSIRNIPRTSSSFSSIYGRGNMGDGVLALPYLAFNDDQDVIAFTGDGAKSLIPDITPFMMKNIANNQTIEHHAVLIVFVNASLSMIRTYQERGTFSDPGLQMAVPFPLPPSGHFNYRGCDFFTEVLCDADPNQFRHILSRKKAFTTLYVLTGHNNRSDAFQHLGEEWFHE